MTSSIAQILKAETFFLDIHDFRDLIRSQCPCNPRLWTTYRLLTTLYLVAVLIWSFIEKFGHYQWIYLTFLSHWAYIALVLSYILKLVCVFKYYKWLNTNDNDIPNSQSPLIRRRPEWILEKPENPVPLLLQISWLVSNIALVLTFHATIGYLPTFIDGDEEPVFTNTNLQIHGINAIFAIVDILLCAQPTFIMHIYQPLLFMATYEAFTAFYYLAGGKNKFGGPAIYTNLDWRRPIDPVLFDVLIYGLNIGIIHFVIFIVSVLRQWIGLCTKRKPKYESFIQA